MYLKLPRRRLPALGLAALLAAALAPGLGSGSVQAQPAALQGLKLEDHRRHDLKAATLKGRVVLMHFVFTTCSTSCPVQVRELAEVHAALPYDVRPQVRFLSVSDDPLQDTPASLADFARRMGAERPGWHFVTGAPPQVHQLLDRMQVMDTRASGGRPMPQDHRTSLYLFDGAGGLLQRYGGVPVDRPRLVAEISQLAHLQRR